MRLPHEPVTWSPVAPRVTGLLTPVRLDPSGVDGPTRGQAEGPAWTRTSHGFYVPTDAPRHLVEQRILEQSVRIPARGAVTGWSACRLLGAAYFDGLAADDETWLPVVVAAGPHRSLAASPDLRVANHVLLPRDRTVAYGIPTVVPARALYDAVRLGAGLRAGVRSIDMMAAAGLCSLAMLRDYAADQPQDAGRVLGALALASEHALSPPETDVRLICELDLGLARLEVNCDIHDEDGRVVATTDLLDVPSGTAIEIDGGHHRRGPRRAADQRRTDILLRLGLEEARIAASEVGQRRLVMDRIRLALSRARYEPVAQRAWYFTRRPDELDGRLRRARPGA